MKTLDQILTQRVAAEQMRALTATFDQTTWTKENRDIRMAASRVIGETIASTGLDFIREILDKEVDGKSLMYLVLFNSMLGGELMLLHVLRENLENTPPDALDALPVDTLWLSEMIRERIQQMYTVQKTIEEALRPKDQVEEI